MHHPSIEIILTLHPLPQSDGSVLLGTAALPEGYVPPDENVADYSELFSQGMRGRQIAYQLAGQVYRTSKQAVQDRREEQHAKRAEEQAEKRVAAAKDKGKAKKRVAASAPAGKTKGAKAKAAKTETSNVAELVRVLQSDDGDAGQPISVMDLGGLVDRWGSRLRIRCTEAEIYYRLTGSHQEVRLNVARIGRPADLA